MHFDKEVFYVFNIRIEQRMMKNVLVVWYISLIAKVHPPDLRKIRVSDDTYFIPGTLLVHYNFVNTSLQ